MKKLLLSALLLLAGVATNAQQRVHQAIIANGEVFEFSPPFIDRASIAAYYPDSRTYEVFDTIHVEAVQSVMIYDTMAFVAATDSLVVYGLNSHQRIAVEYVPGIQEMAVYDDDVLVISKGFGADSNYVELRDVTDFSLIASLPEVNDEAAGIAIWNDFAYVAVPGSFLSTTGRIAVVDIEGDSVASWINLDTLGVGLSNMFVSGNNVIAVSKLAWPNTSGVVSVIDATTNSVVSTPVPVSVTGAAGLHNNLLYFYGNTAGYSTFDISTAQLGDTSVAGLGLSFAAAALHGQNNLLFGTSTDFLSFGKAYLYNTHGTLLDSFPTGISPEGIALDIRAGNARPYAIRDSLWVSANTTSFLDVQANDFDPNGDGLTTEITVALLQGNSNTVNDDSVAFTPFTDYSGLDYMEYRVCDAGGLCDTTHVSVLVDEPFGVSSAQLGDEQLLAWPLPATSHLNLQNLSGNALGWVEVVTLTGSRVYAAQLASSTHTLETAQLAAGLYLLRVSRDGQTVTRKLVVE